MEIRKTTPEDLDQVLEIYEIARGFMRETGNRLQWAGGYPGREQVLKDIEDGVSYVAAEDGVIEVVFMFKKGDDPTYHVIEDGAWLNEEPYGVIHRIAARGALRGAGSECIQWCFRQWSNLRCDTHDDNKVMQHVLEKNGFIRCGRIYIEDGTPRIAYQKLS